MGLENLHFPLDSDEFQLLRGTVTVVEEEFLTRLDDPLGENTDAVVAIHHNHFCVAIRVDRVISEADFVSFPSRVNDKIIVQIEQKAARVLVVDLAATISLVLRNYFSAIFLSSNKMLIRRRKSSQSDAKTLTLMNSFF